jgi:hypothetical protein
MERILFGDNQFFGVNHMSEEKARAQSVRFKDTKAIMEVLDIAYEEGIKVFMCTTHERIAEICDHVRANPEKYPDFQFYPCMPYAHKYANAVTEYGMIEALKRFLPEQGKLGAMLKGGMSLAKKDVEGLAQLLIDAEMKMFHGLKTPVIFLQNVMTDLLLGLGFDDAFKYFADYVKEKYDAEPGFITMNVPKLLDVLEKPGHRQSDRLLQHQQDRLPHVRRHDLYEKTIATRRFRPIAMSVLASGAISPREALEYVCGQKQIESIVFGASSRGNIRQTAQLIRELDAGR